MKYIFLIVMIVLVGCSPYWGLRQQTFTYAGGAKTVYVPKKYLKTKTLPADSSGVVGGQVYEYSNNRSLYFLQLSDTVSLYQWIDTARHVPVLHPVGATMYKRIDSSGRYSREVKQGLLRYGYTNVDFDSQIKFDTCVNSAITPRKKRGLF